MIRAFAEVAGFLLVVAGVAAIWWPVAIIVAGAGLVLWAQGGTDDGTGDDGPGGA